MAVSDNDRKLAALAVEHGYCDQDQVEAGLAEVARLRDLGIEKGLADVLVERSQLTDRQREKLIAVVQPNPLARLLPGYEILGPIGKGGMGVVYKARHLGLDKLVAVKVLPPKFANDPQFVDRFLREARAAGRLNHENIVHAIDAGVQKGYYYYIMEFVEGETAKQRLRRDGILTEAQAIELLRQMGDALAHIHRHDLIHRDVKPENIIYDAEGTAKLCDLGLARVTSEDASAGSKMATFGTPLYISPEQILTPHELDGRCDLYSLGATVYHLVCNTPPYYGDTKAETVAGHLSPDPPPLASTHNPALSAGFCRVLARMLTKDRDQRYLSAEALLADLADLRAGRTPGRAGGGGPNWVVWGGAAAAALLAVGATWALAGGTGGPGAGATTNTITPTPLVRTPVATHQPDVPDPPTTVTPPSTAIPAAVSPGARAYAELRETAEKVPIPTPEICRQLEQLIAKHPTAPWRIDARGRLAEWRRARRVAAAEALRTALAAEGTDALQDAAQRYGDTTPGRAAARARGFRSAQAADAAVGRVAEAAKAFAAGEDVAAAALVEAIVATKHPAVAAPLDRLKRAQFEAAALRRRDAAMAAEAAYHREAGAAWTLAEEHRFSAARDRVAALAEAIADPALRAQITREDLADLERLAALGATVHGVLAEWVAAGRPQTLRLRRGRVHGPLFTREGRFWCRDDQQGNVEAGLADMGPAEIMRLAELRLAQQAPSTLTARGVLLFVHGQLGPAKVALELAATKGASRHRFLVAIGGKQVGDEETTARASYALAQQQLADEDMLAARDTLTELLRNMRFRATDLVRSQGADLRAMLARAVAGSAHAYSSPLQAAAKEIDAGRAGDLAAGAALRAAVKAGEFDAARKAVEKLRFIAAAKASPRHQAILAWALEAARPGVVQPWLAPAWRALVGPEVPPNAVAAWIALADAGAGKGR